MKPTSVIILSAAVGFGAVISCVGFAKEPEHAKQSGAFGNELLRAMQEQVDGLTDQTKNRSKICPVHHLQMEVKVVPIIFGWGPGMYTGAKFPYGVEMIDGGCEVWEGVVLPKTGKVFVCKECTLERTRAIRDAESKSNGAR